MNGTDLNGSRINCQMNNLLEVDEDEMEGVKTNDEEDEKESKANGAHLLSDEQNHNGNVAVIKEPPQSLIINEVNGLKTETCI